MPAEKLLYVIGIDKYTHSFHRKLHNAVLDARRFADVLQDRYGYRLVAEPLLDEQATMLNIRKGLAQLHREAFVEDTVIVYYAGHGIQHPDSQIGYWVPYDANEEPFTYLDHSTVLNDLRKIGARHVMLISDSCYSGTFISQTRGSSMVPTTDELDAMPSRWIYVSGDEETVPDGRPGEGSPFAKSLCDFLQENKKPAIPAWEVFDAVTRLTKSLSLQEPQSEPMRYGHKGGQVVFRLATTELPVVPIQATAIIFPLPENPALQHYMPRSLSAANPNMDFWELPFRNEIDRNYVDNLLETKRQLVVLGTAGTGKSIELQYRAAQWNKLGGGKSAIFARFNTYTNQDIAALLPEGWSNVPPNDLCLFLDGLDEIQPANFHTAIRKLNEFQANHPLIGIVVSCRTNFYELPINGFSGTLPEFDVYYLNDISYAEIMRHAKEKYEIDGEVFLSQVHRNAFEDLVQKPFFLRVLLEHFKRSGGLNIKRSAIMETTLFEGYVGNKEHFFSTGQVLPKPHTFALLEKIAFVMEVMGKNFISDDDLQTLFPAAAEYEQCKFLPAFSRDDNKEQWSFDHNNIQEYLASRVLARQPFSELIELISSEIGGERKIKPSWVNTLSFLISTGDGELANELLNWLATNDREVVIRFEPERVSPEQRNILFQAIYQYYRDKGIWMHSNKFSDKDLAIFGASEESLNYLIEQLNAPESDRNNILNGLSILRYFPLERYSSLKESAKAAILRQLENPILTSQDLYTVIGALDSLKLHDIALVRNLVERYGKRKNQYIRAGLYNIIQHSKNSDEFLQVYLDGLELNNLTGGIDDRETVNLMDESFALTRGISSLKTPEALSTLFDLLGSSKSSSFFYDHDVKEVIENVIEASIKAYTPENNLYRSILGVLQAESRHYQERIITPLLQFFDATNNRSRALIDIWSDEKLDDYDKEYAIRNLIDESSLEQLTSHLVQQKDHHGLQKLYQGIFFNTPTDDRDHFLKLVENQASKHLNIILERPVLRDWASIHQERNRQSFNLLFDHAGLQAEVNRVYEELGKDELKWDDLYNSRSTFEDQIETRFNGAALLVIRELMRGTQKSAIRQSVDDLFAMDEVVSELCFGQIYVKLNNQPDIQPTVDQIEQIQAWCISHPEEHRKVWFLLKKLGLKLPESQLLELSQYPNYSHETELHTPGHLEQLESYLPEKILHAQVVHNLAAPLDEFAWITNAGYALRHRITEAYPLITSYLMRGEQVYSLDKVLVFWFEETSDIESLRELAQKLPSSHLRWRTISLLEEQSGQNEFLSQLLNRIMRDESEDVEHRVYAANHLVKLNDLNALSFLAERITKFGDTALDYRINLGYVSCLTDVNSVPILIDLLLFAQGPKYKKDVFNNLESPVLNGLSAIGAHSPENFVAVKDALGKLMKEQEQTMPELRYLNYTIATMEDQLRKKESALVNVQTALKEYSHFSK